ncbi:hypothetical protein NHP21005_12870 [Helicobacter sp. NHP21005]|uniref:hypothetical protein n=1 Tax=Helicobacter felistomachi TaxID=3040201 RepID=UPI002572F116|nr:hypothetical protein [Helicobacter sp. NHP21005]BEG57599.1 hypothetical protein NHP21005_12870 [Helicobacter sp. NHP21005]
MRFLGVLAVSLALGLQAQEALDTSLIHHHPHKEHKDQALQKSSTIHPAPHTPHTPNIHTPPIQEQTHVLPLHTTPQHTHPPQDRTTVHTPTPQHNTHPAHAKHTPRHQHTSLHLWIYSTVFLTAYFGDGHYKQGYGLLLQKGHVLTSAELAHDKGMYATTFTAQMQDDSAPILICVARLHIKAIDRNRGLALLNTRAFTNNSCQTRPESFYHARIYKRYAQNLLQAKSAARGLRVYYPKVGDNNAFEVRSLPERHISHPLSSERETNAYGRPFFNNTGVFVGMAINPSVIAPSHNIYTFLHNLKQRNLF